MSRDEPSAHAQAVAERAVADYYERTVSTLADLVAFRTVAAPPTPNGELGEFRRLTDYLRRLAHELGLSFEDHGAALVLGLDPPRSGPDRDATVPRLGVLTHADVQPADPSLWKTDPFTLDARNEPGRLIGRGVEDDKSSIATALFAMRALKDREPVFRRRVELIVSLHEESDWEPFRRFLVQWPAPELNVALDAKYPLVTAEKGSGTVTVSVPIGERPSPAERGDRAGRIRDLAGGAFRTQVPGSALATIDMARPGLESELRAAVDPSMDVSFDIKREDAVVRIRASGKAAHSSTPWEGHNAVTHLAAVLGSQRWVPTPASTMVRFSNDLVGLGNYGEKFGNLAHSHPFMGPLTLSLTMLECTPEKLTATLNLRRPVGRSRDEVVRTIETAVEEWTKRNGVTDLACMCDLGDPYHVESGPHLPFLLRVFRHYAHQPGATAVAVGGGTQARLLPNGVNFGPSMPGVAYTGHSSHEFVTVDQLRLNLRMCAAMLVELATI